MKNIDFLNVCYKYINRFINAEELVKMLEEIKNDEIEALIKELKTIMEEVTNEEDELVKNEREKLSQILTKLGQVPEDGAMKAISDTVTRVKKSYDRERDSYERWSRIVKCVTGNKYFDECYGNLSDYELLEYITQSIKAPCPPHLSQERFDELVLAGIKNDARESLWRFAFSYENAGLDMDEIIDYFIKKKDGYYIAEMISAISTLDIDKLVDKITDKELIKDLEGRKDVIINRMTEEKYNKLIAKLGD